MRILYSFADGPSEWNCSQWRCLSPSDVINRQGKHQAKLLHLDSFTQFDNPAVADIVGPADVIIVQRNFITHEIWKAMDYWRGLGKAIIADLDDGYPTLPWSNPAHSFWIENKATLPFAPIQLMMDGLKHCDALASPSKVILDDWKGFVQGLWIPNYAHGAWYHGLDAIKAQKPKDKIVIGWGGSVSHYDSFWFSGVREALSKLCTLRSNVYIKLCGNDPRMLEQLEIPNERKIYQIGVIPGDWPKVVASFDIGIAPLDLREGDKSYDNRRSWIKALEYMLVGVPWIASKSAPYRELEQFGTVTENSEDAWLDALLRIVDNIGAANREAKRIRNKAWKYTLEQNVDNIVGQYARALGLRQSAIGLPNVYYVNWRGGKASAPVPPPPTPQLANRNQELYREIQRASYAAATNWHRGIGLQYAGINFGEHMRYELIQLLNDKLLSAKA